MRRKRTTFDYGTIDSARSIVEMKSIREDLSDYGSGLAERADAGDQIDSTEVRKVTDALSDLDDKIATAELRSATAREHAMNAVHHNGDGRRAPSTSETRTSATRDAALATIERGHKSGVVDDVVAAGIEKQVRAQGSETLQRFVEVTGSDDYLSAFAKLVGSERGHLSLTEAERQAYQRVETETRAMAEGVTTAGGYTLPYVLDPSILLTGNGSVSPLREISRNIQLTAGNRWRGVSSAGVTTQWTGEGQVIPDNSATLGQPSIDVFKGTAFVPFSFEIEEDWAGIYPELTRLVLDGAAQLESAAFTTGSGAGQPKGIITALAAASPSVVVSAITPETFTSADLYALQSALPPRFRPNARWAMSLDMINRVRQFETGNGALKFPELANGTLLGRPVSEISAMDGSINPVAVENNYVVVYGDFQQFAIVSRVGAVIEPVSNLFDPTTGRPTGQRGLLLHWRVGSDVLVPNAFRLLNIPTS